MPNSPVQAAELNRLDRALRSARALTNPLFRQVAESVGERFSILRRAGKTALVDRFLDAGACTDAALALLAIRVAELENPTPHLRERRMALLAIASAERPHRARRDG